jgi:hypothetical protein
MSDLNLTTSVEYRDIPGFPNYRVGSDGTVWSCKNRFQKWFQLKVYPNPYRRNYVNVILWRNNVMYNRSLHGLVLTTFIGPCPPGMEACHHPDPDVSNNRLENLRWDTKKENQKDIDRLGRRKKGIDAPRGRLTDDQVRELRRLRAEKVPVKVVAAQFGIHCETVTSIANRRQRKDVI